MRKNPTHRVNPGLKFFSFLFLYFEASKRLPSTFIPLLLAAFYLPALVSRLSRDSSGLSEVGSYSTHDTNCVSLSVLICFILFIQ